MHPRGLTLRELWMMQCGRLELLRIHAISQAALVWSLGEMSDDGPESFVRFGEINTKKTTPPPYMPEVEEKIAEIQANGGRLIVR